MEAARQPEPPAPRGRTRRTNLLLALITLTLWASLAWLNDAGYIEKRPPTDFLFVAAGFLVAAVGSGVFDDWAHGRWAHRERERLLKIGLRTKAMVTEAWGDEETNITYRFTPQGHAAATQRTETLYRLATQPEVGQGIDIVYDPAAPQYSAIIDPEVIAASGHARDAGNSRLTRMG